MKNFKKSLFIASLAMAFTFGLFISESSSQNESDDVSVVCYADFSAEEGSIAIYCNDYQCTRLIHYRGTLLAPCRNQIEGSFIYS